MGKHSLQGDLSYPARLPLHWAVVVVVILVLPLAFLLGKWSFPIWVCFIVWAEYFTLGAKLDTWKVVIPSLPFGAIIGGAAWVSCSVAIAPHLGKWGLMYALMIFSILWIALLVYGLRWTRAWTVGTLAVFNGLTLFLAVYFTGAYPQIGGVVGNSQAAVWWACLWTILMAVFGWFLGWLNVVLTFGREKTKQS